MTTSSTIFFYPGVSAAFIRNKVGYSGIIVELLENNSLATLAVPGDIDVEAELHSTNLEGETFSLKFVQAPISRLVATPQEDPAVIPLAPRWVALPPRWSLSWAHQEAARQLS